MKQTTFAIFILFCFFYGCKKSKTGLIINEAQDETTCEAKGGVWYNGTCWSAFGDEGGLSKEDVDSVVNAHMEITKAANISVNAKMFPLRYFYALPGDDNTFLFIATFEDEEGIKTLLQEAHSDDLEKEAFTTKASLIEGDLFEIEKEDRKLKTDSAPLRGEFKVEMIDPELSKLLFRGELKNKSGDVYTIAFMGTEALTALGSTTMEIKGAEVFVNGTLGTKGYAQLKDIIDNHPEVKTVVLQDVPGSLNDGVNMHTGRILREAGLHTKVLKTSEIASGGVDLFCAGVERIVEQGARIGIHSWCCVGDFTARELPEEHPEHQYQLAYFSMCLGEKNGPEFYFKTLRSAPFDSVHWMTDEEIKTWKVATRFIEE